MRLKIKEVEKAITTNESVAVAGYTGGSGLPKAREAKVLAVRQRRIVHSGDRSDIGGHPAFDGVLVKYVDGKQEVVGPKNVVATWKHYEQVALAAKRALVLKEERLDTEKRDCEALVEKLGAGYVRSRSNRNFDKTGYYVEINAEEAAQLLR